MATVLLHKFNSTSGSIPTVSTVKQRELAINTADGIVYTQKSDGTIKAINPLYGIKPQAVTVQFTVPLAAYTFVVTVPGATIGQAVMAAIDGTTLPNAFADEYEMEPMAVFGMVYSANTVAFTLTCTDSGMLTMGPKLITYYLG